MTVDGADLYVGGSFTRAGDVDAHRIARYDGYHWYSLGHFNGNVNALSVANGNLLEQTTDYTLTTQGPGIFFVIPCVDSYNKVDLRTVSFDVPPQEVREAGQRRHLFTFR